MLPPPLALPAPPGPAAGRAPTVRSLASKQEKVVLLSWLATLPDTGRPEPLLTAPRVRPTVPRTAPAFAHPGRRARPRLPREPPAAAVNGAGAAGTPRDGAAAAKDPSPLVAPPTPLGAVPSPFGGGPAAAPAFAPEPPLLVAPAPPAAPAPALDAAPNAAPLPAARQEPACLIGPSGFSGYREFYLAEVEPAFPEEARPPAMRPAMALLGMHCRMEVRRAARAAGGGGAGEGCGRIAWQRRLRALNTRPCATCLTAPPPFPPNLLPAPTSPAPRPHVLPV
jgi:hypothetical protein